MKLTAVLLSRVIVLFGISAALATSTVAQQAGTSDCDIPVVPTHFQSSTNSQDVVPDLTAADFSVQVGNAAARIGGVAIDAGPKRIGMVIDGNSDVPDADWRIQAQMAASFLGNARKEDSFSLFIAGIDEASRATTMEDAATRLRGLANARPQATKSTEKIYDAIEAARSSMAPAKFGDTIVVFGRASDEGSSVTAGKLKSDLLRDRTRLIVFCFSCTLARSRDLDDIAHATGYFVSFHSPLALGQPGQAALFERYLTDVYGWIAAPYRMAIERPATSISAPLKISVLSADEHGMRGDALRVQNQIYSCPLSPAVQAPDEPPTPPVAMKIRVGEAVEARELVHRVALVVPDASKGTKGTVVLAIVVGTDGLVVDATYVSGPEELSDSAIAAVKQWKYKPFMLDGQPLRVETKASVVFDGTEETVSEATAQGNTPR